MTNLNREPHTINVELPNRVYNDGLSDLYSIWLPMKLALLCFQGGKK